MYWFWKAVKVPGSKIALFGLAEPPLHLVKSDLRQAIEKEWGDLASMLDEYSMVTNTESTGMVLDKVGLAKG